MKQSIDASLRVGGVHSLRVFASPADFCAIFDQKADTLYVLALLLTCSHRRAQDCFLAALEECRTGRDVFLERALSWSRRAVIKSAIRMLAPAIRNSDVLDDETDISGDVHLAARGLLELSQFERLVFVITILEGYSVHECAALLGSSLREVQLAQVRALQELGGNAHKVLAYENGAAPNRDALAALTWHPPTALFARPAGGKDVVYETRTMFEHSEQAGQESKLADIGERNGSSVAVRRTIQD